MEAPDTVAVHASDTYMDLSKELSPIVKGSEPSKQKVKSTSPADLVKDVGCPLELPDF